MYHEIMRAYWIRKLDRHLPNVIDGDVLQVTVINELQRRHTITSQFHTNGPIPDAVSAFRQAHFLGSVCVYEWNQDEKYM